MSETERLYVEHSLGETIHYTPRGAWVTEFPEEPYVSTGEEVIERATILAS